MPEKSVRSMGRLERQHRSISAKTFRSTVFCCVLLGLVALLMGLVIYIVSMANQYIDHAIQLASIAQSSATRGADALSLSDQVMEKYRTLTEEQRAAVGSEEYRALFAEEREGHDYDVLVHMLAGYLSSDYVYDVYIAMYDEETCAMVYVVDPETEERLYPGEWESVTEKGMRKFLDWDGTGRLYDIDHTENYGWLCTAGLPIQDKAGVTHAFLLVDIDVGNLIAGVKSFAVGLSAAVILLTALIAWAYTRRMKKSIVNPINAIARAAGAYAEDRKAGNPAADHFSALNIHTGDEIENLGLTMADMERNMAEYVDQLTAATAEKERIVTELTLANRIQAAMLPNVFPPFPDRPEIDLYASMDPAREVGGDFYDFYLVDEDHLCLIIADVSGKGIPAALFMMIIKVILQSCAMLGQSPAEILTKTNEAICAKNPEDMFVTVWVGILELSTGRLTAANAGHEYPALRQRDGRFVLYKDPHGLVVGGMEGTRYREYSLDLEPGDKIFVYTDGVPEATDADNRLFGADRMLAALNRQPGAAPEQILKNVREAVDGFVRDAEQFDDLTMLCLEYKGGENHG